MYKGAVIGGLLEVAPQGAFIVRHIRTHITLQHVCLRICRKYEK